MHLIHHEFTTLVRRHAGGVRLTLTELKTIAQGFGTLLRTIIESVDRFGLKKRHLQKQKKTVNRFLSSVQARKLTSELATSYQQRLEKSGVKMFTFLEHDGVPWNNNYAEHAIKRFAKYRRVFDGLVTEDSLTEALILGSILNTCEFNNVNALKFLLSGKKSLDALVKSAKARGKLRATGVTGFQNEEVRPDPSEFPLRNQAKATRVSCTDPDWKDRCRDHLKSRQDIEIADFSADTDREWCGYQAARYGAKCTIRKQRRWARFTFAQGC